MLVEVFERKSWAFDEFSETGGLVSSVASLGRRMRLWRLGGAH
jgi:hypothetical protein